MGCYLRIELLSDACFSGGTGYAGEVDTDIEYEEETGLPMMRGKTLKGLLVEECALLLHAFTQTQNRWERAAQTLFGDPGRDRSAGVSICDARVPEGLREKIKNAINHGAHPLTPHRILKSLTDIRYQTKINRSTGAPQEHSLRSSRVALKGLIWHAPLSGADHLGDEEKAILAACSLAVRRGGVNRNRGWGKLSIRIMNAENNDITSVWIAPLLETDS